MNILFISKYYYPSIGGVEKHIREISLILSKKHDVTIICLKSDKKEFSKEEILGLKVIKLSTIDVKCLGLIWIWIQIFFKFALLLKSDVIHIHDVFIWYLPMRFIFFLKPTYLTIHGWEGEFPIPFKNKIYKRLPYLFSKKTISVGNYIDKYYGIKSDLITYGAVKNMKESTLKKNPKSAVYLGRFSKDTGAHLICRAAKNFKKVKITFIGSGRFQKCFEKFGNIQKLDDPTSMLGESFVCIAGGYLATLESLSSQCKTIVICHNKLRSDCFVDSPFEKWIYIVRNQNELTKELLSSRNTKMENSKEDLLKFIGENSWDNMAERYLDLWK